MADFLQMIDVYNQAPRYHDDNPIHYIERMIKYHEDREMMFKMDYVQSDSCRDVQDNHARQREEWVRRWEEQTSRTYTHENLSYQRWWARTTMKVKRHYNDKYGE